jgi:hypothetical protein
MQNYSKGSVISTDLGLRDMIDLSAKVVGFGLELSLLLLNP